MVQSPDGVSILGDERLVRLGDDLSGELALRREKDAALIDTPVGAIHDGLAGLDGVDLDQEQTPEILGFDADFNRVRHGHLPFSQNMYSLIGFT